jgi:hypothetical protein
MKKEMKKPIEKKKSVKERSYYLKLHSKLLPFALEAHNLKKLDESEKILQKFVRFIEKKFDSIWYIGTDLLGDDIYERFMFHHGGFMEISLKGSVRCFFIENKTEKMKKAIVYASRKLSSKYNAARIGNQTEMGQRLISLKDSLDLGR